MVCALERERGVPRFKKKLENATGGMPGDKYDGTFAEQHARHKQNEREGEREKVVIRQSRDCS